MKIENVVKLIKSEQVSTWFDLGLFIDRVRDRPSKAKFKGSYQKFRSEINQGGIAFITFYYSIDGVTVEIEKYTRALRKSFPNTSIHFLGGGFRLGSDQTIDSYVQRFLLPEMDGFGDWAMYKDFFETRLERGSTEYNALIEKFWSEVLYLVEKLGVYLQENKIKLIFLVNVCSNPGNVSLALASVLLSEYLGIPVINNNHDFYWEGGNRPIDVKLGNSKKGARDLFFTNSHLGEVFSPIEVLYPWESRSWITVNINKGQVDTVIGKKGHNPANVATINTAVDLSLSRSFTKRDKIESMVQVKAVLSAYTNKLAVQSIDSQLTAKEIPGPILLGASHKEQTDFISNNVIFLQPTRVIRRKSIEINFTLVRQLFENQDFEEKFRSSPQLKLTILVSGPIAVGQIGYYFALLQHFGSFLPQIPKKYRDRVFLGFLFSEFDKAEFKRKFESPIGIPELHNLASLILLPSETEGRGLPIIEAAASGTPIFCRRYEPQEVYSEVIGEHLYEQDRLKVLEFKGNKISKKLVQQIINQIFYPQNFTDDVFHNNRAIQKRFSIEALQENLENITHRLFLQLKSIGASRAKLKSYFEEYDKLNHFENDDLNFILNKGNRHYLPGFGRLTFMLHLKSLIDPSYFRVEEQEIKGMIMEFARILERANDPSETFTSERIHNYYNLIDDIFHFENGEIKIRHDHSMSYRHRNRTCYAYQSYTYQELTGLVNFIYNKLFPPRIQLGLDQTPYFFSDWDLALYQLTNSHYLAIDNREILIQRLKKRLPRGYFPGRYLRYEMELFVLQPIRAILKLTIAQEMTEEFLRKRKDSVPPVYVFIHENHTVQRYSSAQLEDYLTTTRDRELNLLYRYGIIRIVKSKQWCTGIHFSQMGTEALKALREIKENNGFIIANGENCAMMTDILDIDHFHIGRVNRILTGKIMGIPVGSGFIQFVPGGVRTALAYPTPIQTSKDFDQILNGKRVKKLTNRIGKRKFFALLTEDARERGNPLNVFLESLEKEFSKKRKAGALKHTFISGVYDDGLPWSGVMAGLGRRKSPQKWAFSAHTAGNKPRPVPMLVQDFKRKTGENPSVSWNGGYILNPELVGKLGLAETYIGSPLGLLVLDKEVICPPLFNKPAFIIYRDGSIDIERVNCSEGLLVSNGSQSLEFRKDQYNPNSSEQPCYYDLLYDKDELTADGNFIVRLAGNVVKEIISSRENEKVPLIPVGLTLSIPPQFFNERIFRENQKVGIQFPLSKKIRWDEISHAVEAGPMLLTTGEVNIDMKIEGWKSRNSIRTQAARLDFTDMRGPKIAVGLTKDQGLIVLMVNGRIRESVGATHHDMAAILKSLDVQKAMGFDPGGSSTLVVEGKPLNISPYNSRYEEDVYSLPPEPRFVANAIMGWEEPN